MRIAVMGAGGIGGYYGGRLAHAGEDVTFIARGEHLRAMQQQGLSVESPDGGFRVRPTQAAEDPARVGPVELVIVATKAYDLEAGAQQMRPLVGADTTVLPLLNGVDIHERLGAVLGTDRVLGGLCYVSSSIVEPGRVRRASPNEYVQFGEPDGTLSERGRRIEATLQNAGISATLSENILGDIWSKFHFITAAAGVCAVTATVIGPVLEDPDTRALFEACMDEVEAVGRAHGVALRPDMKKHSLDDAAQIRPGTKPSMLLDLERGKPLEVEVLNGTVARLGREHGIPTPVNQFIYAALKHRAAGRTE